MRPSAIVNFERLYLISLLLVVAQQVIAFLFVRDMVAGFMPQFGGAGEAGVFNAVMIFAMLFGLALGVGVPLIFWWLAARKRQEFAKWVLLVLSVLSGLSWLLSLAVLFVLPGEAAALGGASGFQAMIIIVDGVAEGLGIMALVYLFRREAEEWFRGHNPAASADVFR